MPVRSGSRAAVEKARGARASDHRGGNCRLRMASEGRDCRRCHNALQFPGLGEPEYARLAAVPCRKNPRRRDARSDAREGERWKVTRALRADVAEGRIAADAIGDVGVRHAEAVLNAIAEEASRKLRATAKGAERPAFQQHASARAPAALDR